MTDESTNHDEFTFDVTPYLLGALDHDEARAFEAHLRVCDQCSDELIGTSTLADRLRLLDEAAFAAAPPPPPHTLLARLLREVDRERRASQRRTRLVLAAAACIAALLAATVTAAVVSRPHHQHPAAAIALVPAFPNLPVQAAVRLTPQGDSTGLDLTCSYAATGRYGERAYHLVVTNREGTTATVSTWTIDAGQSLELHAQAPWARHQLSRISLQTEDGREVLGVNL